MSDYNFRFSNDGTPAFVVKPYTANGPQSPLTTSLYINPISSVHAVSANTPLVLTGKGVPEYGEMVQNNLVYLAENFAGPTRPQPPLKGMLWYKDTVGANILFPTDPATKGLYLWNNVSWSPLLISGEITAPVDVGNQKITNLGLATDPNDAVSVAYLNANILTLGGGTLTGDLATTPGHYFISPELPVLGNHVTNKTYVDAVDAALQNSINLSHSTLSGQITTLQNTDTILSNQIAVLDNNMIIADQALSARIDAIVTGSGNYLPLTGGALSGPVIVGGDITIHPNSNFVVAPGNVSVGGISFGDNVVQAVGSPVSNTDAANKLYVDDTITDAITNIVFPPNNGAADGVTTESIFNPSDTAGYQTVVFTTLKSGPDATGLANDATVYTATINIDGVDKNISINGFEAQIFSNLFTEINNDLGGAGICQFTNTGYLKILSTTSGEFSSVAISDTDLFNSLTDYVTIAAPVPGVPGGSLILVRSSGLDPVVTRDRISPMVHNHMTTQLLYDLSREYSQSALMSFFATNPNYPLITLKDIITSVDQMLYAAAQNKRRQIVVAGVGGITNLTLNDEMAYEISSNNLQIFQDGIKLYADERGTSTLTFQQPNVGLKSLVPITPGSYDFTLTWDGTATVLTTVVTADYTYLDLLNALYLALSSLPTSTSGYEDVTFSGAGPAGGDATGLTGGTTYAATVKVDDSDVKSLLITGVNAATFTDLLTEINIDLAGAAVATLDSGNHRIRITSTTTGETSSISITDATVNPLFSSLPNYQSVATPVPPHGWQPVGLVNDQRPNEIVISFISSLSGGPGSSMVVSYSAGELFEQIDSCSAPVNTSVSGSLGYEEVGIPGTLSTQVTFNTVVPNGNVLEILVSQ